MRKQGGDVDAGFAPNLKHRRFRLHYLLLSDSPTLDAKDEDIRVAFEMVCREGILASYLALRRELRRTRAFCAEPAHCWSVIELGCRTLPVEVSPERG